MYIIIRAGGDWAKTDEAREWTEAHDVEPEDCFEITLDVENRLATFGLYRRNEQGHHYIDPETGEPAHYSVDREVTSWPEHLVLTD